MIDEKKLLCAFIDSAYKSGYCGRDLDDATRTEHMIFCEDYIKNELYFPQDAIEAGQQEMMQAIERLGVRGYIYKGHFDVVKSRIEQGTEQDFESAIKNAKEYLAKNPRDLNAGILISASMLCPVNFYKVTQVSGKKIFGKNLLNLRKKQLSVLEGLETPNIGDIVSGHWDYMLEIVNDLKEFPKYLETAKEYSDNLSKFME